MLTWRAHEHSGQVADSRPDGPHQMGSQVPPELDIVYRENWHSVKLGRRSRCSGD